MAGEQDPPSDPLNFWLAVEAFSPQKVPAVSSSSRGDTPFVADVRAVDALPWESESGLPPSGDRFAWQHTVYLGVFALESAWEVLMPKGARDRTMRESHSAVVMVVVNEDGTLQLPAATLSQCAWAAGTYAVRDNLNDVFQGFGEAKRKWERKLAELVVELGIRIGQEAPDSFCTHPVNHSDLAAILGRALDLTGARRVLSLGGRPVNGVRILSEQRCLESRDTGAGQHFLNSFFSEDLYTLSEKPRTRGGVRQYLGLEQPDERVDVRRSLRTVYDGVAPNLVPDGRWPSDTGCPLALSQQFAVNRALADLVGTEGIFAVNGPPGTGKTTMLRDMVAALVTQRATALAAFTDPAAAFGKPETLQSLDAHPRTVHPLHPSLRGFEILIASSNNGAVENISLEIPGKNVIDPQFHERIDYFTDLATVLLNSKNGGNRSEKSQQEAWALMSATLGNANNKRHFISTALYTDTDKPKGIIKNDGRGNSGSTSGGRPAPGLFELLKDEATASRACGWDEARSAFLTAKERVQELRAERQVLHDAFLELPLLRTEIATLAERLRACTNVCQVQENLLDGQDAEMEHLQQLESNWRGDLAVHAAAKPRFLEQLFTLGRALVPWRGNHARLSAGLQEVRDSIDILEHAIEKTHLAVLSLRQQKRDMTREYQRCQLRQLKLEGAKDAYRHTKYCPENDWFDEGNQKRELGAPWLDEEFNKARTELFLEALNLHKAFIFSQRAKMGQNLRSLQDVLKGLARDETGEQVLWAWEALFLVVPTVTTTLASTRSLLGSLKDRQLGWLFIDEAGQAAPQHAYCGISRARKTLLVGDPLQLTPIVTLPIKYQERLLEMTGTDKSWMPSSNPAQVLADRSARYGTFLSPPDTEELWVGAPLRVHRRCNNPMFEVVNQEVYGGLMIHGGPTDQVPFPAGGLGPEAPPSAWFDVQTFTWDGHASGQEINKLAGLLSSLQQAKYDMSKILVITPFRNVETKMEQKVGEFGIRARTHAGTIHKAQGKEADIVIIVLGGSTAGARSWAVGAPNLFNVAVSRAKRRLYIIGDQNHWAKLQYFKALASRVVTHTPEQSVNALFSVTPRMRDYPPPSQPSRLTH